MIFTAHYAYDANNLRVLKQIDSDGDGAVDSTSRYVYDDQEVALVLDENSSVTTRYLHGPAIDQILASETASHTTGPGAVLWALTDNQNTVRDLLDSSGALVDHRRYDSFGKMTAETNTAVDFVFAYTGRELDETGDQYNRARYYDSATHGWLSQDPLGFSAGDSNLYRYVGNERKGEKRGEKRG